MTVEQIYTGLRDRFAALSGHTPLEGSEFSLRLYAYAAQIEALFLHMDWVERQCFPQTASGESLELHAAMRGVTRGKPIKATGTLCFGRDEASGWELSVPAGTVCLTRDMIRFETTQAGVIPPDERVCYVQAAACEEGPAGNVPGGAVVLMSQPPAGVSWCANPAPFSGGQAAEDDERLRAKVLETYRRLPNGANAAFYQNESLRVPGVAAANVLPRVNGRGTIGVVVSAVAGRPEPSLVEAVAARLAEVREIAVDITVRPPDELDVAVEAAVAPLPGYEAAEVRAAAEQALRGHFTGALLGRAVRLADLAHLLHEAPGVLNYRITAPAADIPGLVGRLPVLSALSVGDMDGEDAL